MPDRYVDLALASGTNAGTSWANAYQGPAGLVSAAAAAAAGEIIWVKGQKTAYGANVAISCVNGTATNPVLVIGVLSATTNEPPQASDLISGYRTGASTPAYEDADVPTIAQSNVNWSITIDGQIKIWGLCFKSGTSTSMGTSTVRRMSGVVLEECHVEWNASAAASGRALSIGIGGSGAAAGHLVLLSCRFRLGDSDDYIVVNTNIDFHNCVFDSRSTYRSDGIFIVGALNAWNDSDSVRLFACDLSAIGAAAIFDVDNMAGDQFLYGCLLASSYVLTAGTRTNHSWSVTSIGSQSNPSFSATDSIRTFDYESTYGGITEDTAIVRTGGANDGGSGQYTWAMTPDVNGTRDNTLALMSPWMSAWVEAGSQTLTVYIANSGSGDYQNDEVALEVFSPAESTSTVRLAHRTTRCDLLATPANVTDDTSSDWGTGAGGKNAQKLTVDISPAYTGQVFVRVLFSKNFAASPETLYVDPRIYGAATPTQGTMPLGLFGGFMGSPDPATASAATFGRGIITGGGY